MPTRLLTKRRARQMLIDSMRACVAANRLPFPVKKAYISRCAQLVADLDTGSGEPVESDEGLKFVTTLGDSISISWLMYRGTYEPVLSQFIRDHMKADDVAVDVGANIGYFSLLMSTCVRPSGKVIAIEASPSNARRLRANIELNNADDIVEIVVAACAPEKGELTLYEHPRVDGWHRLTPPAEGDPDRHYMGDTWIPVVVPADTLASMVGADAERVSFIKVDVEGAETALTPEIATAFPHPDLVVALEVRADIETTLKPFKDNGFHIYDLHNDYRWLYERKVPAITRAQYPDFYECESADLLLSRRPLALP
ncbi:FkbM family methyltransferase [Mycolicibacterium aichiense]|uniref:FkbM family methyltransferase n=1 Tax=Mycolicibacterium aichiense TaxID=1799 RepID=UPI003D66ACDD